ncbi:MAG TPA: hypothetical protein DIU15_02775 [Deltaproteobacteria bacterium]|nr:hypothetical protein [Deltaproteobacteria bacterium]
MSVGFGLASVANALSGLAAAAILYRLYFATWYVLLIAGVPGFLYVLLACWMATGFAASLREVEA